MAPRSATRRTSAILGAIALFATTGVTAASADSSPAPKVPGLYGSSDPKFDGVFRQSLAFLAQNAAGVSPAPQAVDWLAGQQCADGGYPGFRADTGKPCDEHKGEFTDNTAVAVQALAAVGGRGEQVKKGLDWLTAHQNADGGWGMGPGETSNSNSTAAAIGALAAAGKDPAKVTAKSGKSPYDALLTFQLGCDAKGDDQGAFGWAPQNGQLTADNSASAASALAALGKGYLVPPAGKDDKPVQPLDCKQGNGVKGAKDPQAASSAASAYLVKKLDATGDHLESSMPGAPKGPDFGVTADAVTALAAGGHRQAAEKPLKWLESKDAKAVQWAKGDSGQGDPGRLAKLVLAAHAAGADPRDFAGTDLVAQLNATGPKPAATPTQQEEKKKEKGTTFGVWWFVGVCLVAGIGVGFLLSGRKKQQS
ncbi:prenyltransferase/squalene oxidase repeat-containing protein [Streptomyces orinoci]|uniref:Prenyltransferase/squalene oxidase repeat-containing protein n=1 Tax=Streptomyces orinoci TaxID=67339 RepID=A0ABV3JVD5_STRON|nr:prenyltransferase/squalene oxidase repeat-containing protein [Streptomyces orinoci]